MKKFKFLNVHVLLGAIVGIIVATIINIEASWFYWAVNEGAENFEPVKLSGLMKVLAECSPQFFETLARCISIVIFIIIIVIFNSKRVKRIRINKIGVYLLFSIVISFIVAYSIGLALAYKVTTYYNFEQMNIMNVMNIFTMNTLVIGLFVVSIGTFITIFMLLVNSKVKYIRFLTKEVKKFKEEGFGKTIEVKGCDEISELCESINSMSLELKEKIDNERKLENNKNELITNVSHDLRTPLTSIIGYIDLIKKREYNSEEQFNEYVSIIDQKSKNLNKLINELFEYTKLNNHDIKLNYSEVELVSLIQQVIGEYIYIFEKEGLKLIADIKEKDIYIKIDIEKIVRVLENLLTNAKKYSVSDCDVVVKLKEEDDNVCISLSNKTNEIKEEDLSKIFERFYKGDKARKETDSSGLGLSIVKRIVELHNGSIAVELNDDIISFIIKLPL